MAKKDKGINPDLEEAISSMLAAVMSDPDASITDKTKVLDRALKLEQIKLKMSDDEWGSGFGVDDNDEQDQNMSIFNRIGDIHGCNSFSTRSVRGHIRPLDYDSGSQYVIRSGMLDHVGVVLGESHHSSHIRSIQLSCNTDKGKESK